MFEANLVFQLESTSVASLPCSCVLTASHMLMCHEEVQTHFFRTLASVNVTDISELLTELTPCTYLILVSLIPLDDLRQCPRLRLTRASLIQGHCIGEVLY